MEIPRRIRLDQNVPAELAIRAAIHAVEEMPADVRLTDAVVSLGNALNSVADFVDAKPRVHAPHLPDSTKCPRCGLLVFVSDEPEPTLQGHAPSPPPSTGWQPIDSAPKDGTLLILADHGGVFCGDYDTKVRIWRDSALGRAWMPTHWMPLPAPPASTVPALPASDKETK